MALGISAPGALGATHAENPQVPPSYGGIAAQLGGATGGEMTPVNPNVNGGAPPFDPNAGGGERTPQNPNMFGTPPGGSTPTLNPNDFGNRTPQNPNAGGGIGAELAGLGPNGGFLGGEPQNPNVYGGAPPFNPNEGNGNRTPQDPNAGGGYQQQVIGAINQYQKQGIGDPTNPEAGRGFLGGQVGNPYGGGDPVSPNVNGGGQVPTYPGAAAGSTSFNPSNAQNADGSWSYNGESQNPAMATNAKTESEAQAAWFKNNPGFAQYAGAGASGGNLTGQGGNSGGTGATGTGSPAGQSTAQQINGTAPAPYNAFGGTPSVTPTYGNATGYNAATGAATGMNAASQGYTGASAAQQGYAGATGVSQNYQDARAAMVDPNQNQAYLQQFEGAVGAGLNPMFQQQDQALQDQMAARGISSSGAAQYLSNNLMGQQAGAYANAIQPMIGQAAGYTHQDIAANQGNRQATNFANQNAANTASGANSGYAQQANLFTAGNNQRAIDANSGYIQQANLFNAGNATTAQGANAGYQQQANQFNANAGNTFGMANMNAQNQANQYNATAGNEASFANAGIANNAAAQNAGYYQHGMDANYASYNNYLTQLLNSGVGMDNAKMTAYLNSFGPNSGVTSGINQGMGGAQNVFGTTYQTTLNNQQQQQQGMANAAAKAAAAGG